MVAEVHVGGGQSEEPEGERDKNKIVHGAEDIAAGPIRLIKNRAKPVKKTLRAAKPAGNAPGNFAA